LYDPSFRSYYGIGKNLGKAFSIGREVMKWIKFDKTLN
jgi:hypothetical protein